MSVKNTQSRKWLLTLNQPQEKGYTHQKIRELFIGLKSVTYYCMSDEIGLEQQTPHTHVFIAAGSPIRFTTIKKRFPQAHIDVVRGSCAETKAYIEKSGKWENDKKHGTSVPGTFEEWGSLPVEQSGRRTDWEIAYDMLENGCSVMDIIRKDASMMRYRSILEQTRQELKAEQFRDTFRLLETTYIYGETGLGKTRYVMEKYGYSNVCQITGYQHGCFDKYQGENVIIFDEFASSFKIQDMNNFLDGYPLMLPCRYANKTACYQKAYIISNIRLEAQYPVVRVEAPAVWDAFIRRIHKVMIFYESGKFDTFTTEEYFKSFQPYVPVKGGDT